MKKKWENNRLLNSKIILDQGLKIKNKTKKNKHIFYQSLSVAVKNLIIFLTICFTIFIWLL